MREPQWFKKDGNLWRCTLCPTGCVFPDKGSSLGRCRIRGVKDGIPYLPGYGMCVSLSIDPIEKKPLYHFRPGSMILSSGPAGCNLTCDFCQNWSISQSSDVPQRYVSPSDLAEMAMGNGSTGIAYTYTEPSIWYEYICDSAPKVREKGGVAVMVSNGTINPEPLTRLIEVTDAWNVDLKSWSDDFYREHCGGNRKTVLETLVTLAHSKCHLEVTFLVIPGENDFPDQWREMAGWLADECGEDTVLHISRYFPRYRLRREPTPIETLNRAQEIFSERLKHVYIGNVSSGDSDTLCPVCGSVCIRRNGWQVALVGISSGRCASCGADLNLTV